MSITFQDLLSDCLVALGDDNGLTWSRINKIWPWCIEAMRTFPFGRPMKEDHTLLVGEDIKFDLPSDFREVISVEFPVNQNPPQYLTRLNRFDPNFYSANDYYDIDYNFADAAGWIIHFSAYLKTYTGSHVYIDYLADHDLDMADDALHFITVADEFYTILISQVICRAYRERLSYFMQDPTVHTSIVYQLTEMVRKAEEHYASQVAEAQERLAKSRLSPHQPSDKYDRIY
jgi:hypothetical protein